MGNRGDVSPFNIFSLIRAVTSHGIKEKEIEGGVKSKFHQLSPYYPLRCISTNSLLEHLDNDFSNTLLRLQMRMAPVTFSKGNTLSIKKPLCLG